MACSGTHTTGDERRSVIGCERLRTEHTDGDTGDGVAAHALGVTQTQ